MSEPHRRREPFFTGAGPTRPAAPRLLLLSYFFPPSQAVGALRWQKFAAIAWERGWELDVFCLDPHELNRSDTERLRELPPGTRVFGVRPPKRILEMVGTLPARLRGVLPLTSTGARTKPAPPEGQGQSRGPASIRASSLPRDRIGWDLMHLRGWARAYHALVDHERHKAWARSAATAAAEIFERGVHRCVVSNGPPHLVHEGGRWLAGRFDIPFVMDMRDPWALQQRLLEEVASPLWFRLAEQGEQACVRDAAVVVANTEALRLAMQRTYPYAADKMICVMNGYDQEDVPIRPSDDRFLIAYAGTVYLDRNPRMFFRATAQVVNDLHLTPRDFGIEFMGNVSSLDGLPLAAMAAEEGIAAFVQLKPPGPRREALQLLAKASMLLSLPQDSDLAIPSKVFEYMLFPAWLLALADPGSATALLLAGTEADLVRPDDIRGIAATLRHRYEQHRLKLRPEPLAAHSEFSRRSQSVKLFDAIEARTTLPPGAG